MVGVKYSIDFNEKMTKRLLSKVNLFFIIDEKMLNNKTFHFVIFYHIFLEAFDMKTFFF